MKKRLLQTIREQLELILPVFVFDLVLKIFRKLKLILKSIIPESFFKIVGKVKQRIMCEYVNFRYKNYSSDKLAKLYNQDYHKVYINNSDEIELKKWQVVVIKRAIPELKKVLVAGCSGGELVRALRNIGIDAYGFDVSPDLDKIAISELRAYIKQGNILNIPFSTDDKFDAFIAVDIFEHIPMNQVNYMVKEIARINAKYMITIINHFDYMHLGHITMKPLLWWQRKFRNYYEINENINFSREEVPLLYSINNDSEHKFLFWERVQ